MIRSTPGLPVHHQLPEFTQTHVHLVGDAVQPPHPLSSPSPPAPNPSQLVSYIYFLLFFVLPPHTPQVFFCISKPYIKIHGVFLDCPIVKDFPLPLQGSGVLSLIKELRSHMPHVMAPPQKKFFFLESQHFWTEIERWDFFFWSASHIYMRKLLCRKEKGTILGLWSQKKLDQVQILGQNWYALYYSL